MNHAMSLAILILLLCAGFSLESAPRDSSSWTQREPVQFYFRDGKLRRGILLQEEVTHFVVKTRNGKIVRAAKSALEKVITKEGGLKFKRPSAFIDSPAVSVSKDSLAPPPAMAADTAPEAEGGVGDTALGPIIPVPVDSLAQGLATPADTAMETKGGAGDTALLPIIPVPA